MTGRFLVAVALVLATALAAAWASQGAAQATTFNPFFGPPDFYRLDPSTPGSAPDVHAQFNILPPSANFSRHFGGSITFEDPDLSIASSAQIPGTGAYVGRVESVAQLGLANEGCNTETTVTLDLIESHTSTAALSITNGGPMTVGSGGLPAVTDDALTDFAYVHPLDPMGTRQGTDGPGLGGFPEGTIIASVNEIRIDLEEMLVVGVDTATNTYRVIRGWNGTVAAPHLAGAEVQRVNVIYPNGPATNLLANQGEDDGDLDNNGVVEHTEYVNGVPDGADAVPSFVRNSLDPNVNADDGGSVQAHARYVGVALVANSLVVIFQFVIMSPGALVAFPNLDWATSAWGFGSITFLQDPLAPPSDSAITDFCNFSSNTLLYGTTHDNACTGAAPPAACAVSGPGFALRLAVDGGCPGLTTPNECGSIRLRGPATAQALRVYQYAVSQRDYDNDGHENALDTCPYNPNASWDPHSFNSVSGGDGDGDGLPDACDPAPGSPNPDHDGDGWSNRLDNCPTVSNVAPIMAEPNFRQFDQDTAPGLDVYDGGPPSDDIGPECDIAGNSCSGCWGVLTPTGANGHYHATYAAQTICIGTPTSACSDTADDDEDGVVNAHDTCIGNPATEDEGPRGGNPPTRFSGPLANTILTAPANSGDSTIIVASASGFTVGSPIVIQSPLETLRYITSLAGNTVSFTPPLSHNHGVTDPVAQVSFAQSIRDVNNDGFVDMIGDMSRVSDVVFTSGGDPSLEAGYQARYDVNNNSHIGVIDDLAAFAVAFGATCGPPSSFP